MTQQTQQEDIRKKALEEFVNPLEEAKKIQELLEEVRVETRPNKYEKVRNTIATIAYNYAKQTGAVNESVVKSPEEFEKKYGEEVVGGYVSSLVRHKINRASSALTSNLSDILSTIDPKDEKDRKTLEGLLSNEKVAPLIHKKASNEYKKWFNLYASYLSARELEENAKNGRLNENEKNALMNSYAIKVAQEARKKVADSGADKKVQEEIEALTYRVVLAGAHGDKTLEGAKEIVKKAKENLEKYESENKVNVVGYVSSAIQNLAKGNAEEFNTAREITYELVKHKV